MVRFKDGTYVPKSGLTPVQSADNAYVFKTSGDAHRYAQHATQSGHGGWNKDWFVVPAEPGQFGESNPVSYGKAAGGNPVKGSKVAGNPGTQQPITGVGSDRKFSPAVGMVQASPEDSEVKKQTKRKVSSEGIDWNDRLKRLRRRRGEPVGEAGPPVPPPPDDTETFGGDWPEPSDKTKELAELWREDQAGEYIQINDDESAYYIAHGRAIERIAPPLKDQRQSNFVGGDPRRGPVSREGHATESQTFKLIRAWMAKNNYSPNIWKVNERGNVELYNHNGKPLGGLV